MTKKEKVLGFLTNEAKMPFNIEELSVILGVPEEDRAELFMILTELTEEGSIIKTKRDRYSAPKAVGCVSGRFIQNERGFGFVEIEGDNEDIFIPADNSGCALHHDIVLCRLDAEKTGFRRSGSIIKIIKRSNEELVGEFTKNKKVTFVIPDSKKLTNDIYIAKENTLGAKDGDKVLVRITAWNNPQKNPEGKVTEILGKKDDFGIDILSIAKESGLRTDFPNKVKEFVKEVPNEISKEDIKDRLDLRNKQIITIDGDDAKDLDDAVSLEMTENGLYRLGVHIADVGHYVKRNNPLDKEAYLRGTSVYLTDRVIPMLPKELSNGICSLNPHVDRLTLSVFMEIDKNGEVVSYEISESVINSCERMTYKDVTAICEGDKKLIKKYEHIYDMLKLMEELKDILYNKRRKRGSIDFDFPEAKVLLDDEGKPISIEKREITLSNQIIEEFMLVCNETVAEHMFWQNIPFMYRVHEAPSEDKINEFTEFIKMMGYSIKKTKSGIHSKEYQKLIASIKGTKEERIISTVMLRSMAKAKYTHENLGHFGLAAKYYTHFTSPIRRYPDLVIHRIIKDSLKGVDLISQEGLADFVEKAAVKSSEAELSAMEAERNCLDMKMAEYMSQFVGEKFSGVISSVTSFGMFVELSNTVEGLVSMSDLLDDYYIYDDKTKSLVGERRKKVYKIGDSVDVILIKADKESRRIDFMCK